ncbi:hypothetical protein BDW68DRAFT_178395 [Aspergillus falconensis]
MSGCLPLGEPTQCHEGYPEDRVRRAKYQASGYLAMFLAYYWDLDDREFCQSPQSWAPSMSTLSFTSSTPPRYDIVGAGAAALAAASSPKHHPTNAKNGITMRQLVHKANLVFPQHLAEQLLHGRVNESRVLRQAASPFGAEDQCLMRWVGAAERHTAALFGAPGKAFFDHYLPCSCPPPGIQIENIVNSVNVLMVPIGPEKDGHKDYGLSARVTAIFEEFPALGGLDLNDIDFPVSTVPS